MLFWYDLDEYRKLISNTNITTEDLDEFSILTSTEYSENVVCFNAINNYLFFEAESMKEARLRLSDAVFRARLTQKFGEYI